MTKLYYRVGNEKITSYAQAVARSKSLGLPLTSCYEPVIEPPIKGYTDRARKRLAAFKAKA